MDIPVEFINVIIAFFITTIGATLQGSIGFGLGLVGVPLLVLLDPVFVPGPLLLAALCLTLLIAIREHHAVKIQELKWAITGRIAGTVIGAWILTIVPREEISLLFGSMVLLAIAITLSGFNLSLKPANLFGAGTFSGLMGTTSAIGGAPMALVYQRQKGAKIRGTLSSIFVAGTIISITSLAIIGRFGQTELKAALVLIPGMILGFFFSKHTSKILDRGFIRPAVIIASAISGIVVILQNIL